MDCGGYQMAPVNTPSLHPGEPSDDNDWNLEKVPQCSPLSCEPDAIRPNEDAVGQKGVDDAALRSRGVQVQRFSRLAAQ